MINFDSNFKEYYDLSNSMYFLYRKFATEQKLPFLNDLNKEVEELKDKLIQQQLSFWLEKGLNIETKISNEIQFLFIERDYNLMKPQLIIDFLFKAEGRLNLIVFELLEKIMWMHLSNNRQTYNIDRIVYLWGYLFEYMMNYYENPEEKFLGLIQYACSISSGENNEWHGYRDNTFKGLIVLMNTESKGRYRALVELSENEDSYISESAKHIIKVRGKDLINHL